jgi:MazG family protein
MNVAAPGICLPSHPWRHTMVETGGKFSLDDLLAVMARLRDPISGCPWDAKQTFATIALYTIEEAYEVADAIAREDVGGLEDELGDLLLQVVYHAQMAAEQSLFGFADVVDVITRKMIRRHPHVFAEAKLRDAFLSSDIWERIKAEEKAVRRGAAPASHLDDVPLALPSLTRAVKLQKRAAAVGFDWPSFAPVLAKAEEEIAELKEAIDSSGDDGDRAKRVKEEFGDLLFVMANLARHLKVDPEAALRDANGKFVRRFRSIEAALAKDGRACEDATLEEMDQLWDEAKAAEGRI